MAEHQTLTLKVDVRFVLGQPNHLTNLKSLHIFTFMNNFPTPPEDIQNLPNFLHKYPESALGYFFGMLYVIMPEKKLEHFALSQEGANYFIDYIQVLRKEFLDLKTYLRLEPQNFLQILQKTEELLNLQLDKMVNLSNIHSSKIEELEFRILTLINNCTECCFLYSYFSIIHQEGISNED